IRSGPYAGTYCDGQRAYRDYTRCPYGLGAGTGYLTCAEAGVTGYGCVPRGPYAGLLCSNGYLYEDPTCEAYYGGRGGGSYCNGATCADYGAGTFQCIGTPYGQAQCASDGCMYLGCGY